MTTVSPPRLSTLVLMAIIGIIALNMTLPSLAHMAGDFDITYAEASLSISLFMIVTAVLQLIVGPIADVVGRRPVLLASLVIFLLASAGCALAPNYLTFMIFRVLQGAVIVANLLSRAIVRDTSAPQEATGRLATIGMVTSLGPMVSPFLGGLLDQAFGWRATYHVFWVLGLALLWLCWADVAETGRAQGKTLAQHGRAYGALIRNGKFWSYAMSLGLSVGVFFGFLTGAPLLATETFGLSPALLGIALGAPPVGFLLGNALSVRLSTRMSVGQLVIAGRLVSVIGLSLALITWWLTGGTALSFFAFMPFIGLANGLTLPAANVGAMSVEPDLAGSAAGLSGALMVGSGAVMSYLTGWILTGAADPLRLLMLLVATSVLALIVALPVLNHELALEA
ncbi:multidrug effflux MFS transporter [Ponticoccus sp. SC2-23]|uniref:multidrug effflux MFS transporter n=1 Tax=Alexandriicola marinus TaxID=2081710 RepID=UPI000FD8D15C|nr:multidrug effflux MFS transporter [Alexandriicola marinus]MBM1219331.1 multidrug effflux MFS transporter [Ponticoccus sp. SC6-9]MBM1223597.1 multidrug effflux MFS transporter [Ponticoccus sp. SC6-15]MBM1229144.1 multidrug effflux MFS transporter [Ponticoccus sp. SC6-38]MBM1232563.1 multidrug effflux MFS transporter [Ponticoccus sp. SC6-45]MBM1237487.1 multidrug effflux MFS transporter [Ponticoccus sp. SC6-49]MBM1241574.1 multidrug effflux MFS transporter [Ponticoccus sp. SC2-64]MBM1246087